MTRITTRSSASSRLVDKILAELFVERVAHSRRARHDPAVLPAREADHCVRVVVGELDDQERHLERPDGLELPLGAAAPLDDEALLRHARELALDAALAHREVDVDALRRVVPRVDLARVAAADLEIGRLHRDDVPRAHEARDVDRLDQLERRKLR